MTTTAHLAGLALAVAFTTATAPELGQATAVPASLPSQGGVVVSGGPWVFPVPVAFASPPPVPVVVPVVEVVPVVVAEPAPEPVVAPVPVPVAPVVEEVAPEPTPEPAPEPEPVPYETRARTTLDQYGCADVTLTVGGIPPEYGGLAHWYDTPQRVTVAEGLGDVERVAAHECAHILQFRAHASVSSDPVEVAVATVAAYATVWGGLPLDNDWPLEKGADCIAARWGFTGGTYATVGECDRLVGATDAVLAGVPVAVLEPAVEPEPVPTSEPVEVEEVDAP